MSGALVRWRRCQAGVAAIESALLAPILLGVGFVCADIGNLLLERHRMKAGLVSGARLLAKAPSPPALEAVARNVAVTGQVAGGTARVNGWTTADVDISYRMISSGGGVTYAQASDVRIIRLESERDYTGFGVLPMMGLGAITFDVAHEERWTG